MAVYCEPLSDERILAQLGDARRVLIIGCPSCPAISYALDGSSPVVALTINGIKSNGIKNEMDRLTQLLTRKGVHVEYWIPKFLGHLCEIDRDELRTVSRQYQSIDAIIVLACGAGKENIEDGFKGARKVCAMEAKGLVSFPIVRKLNRLFPDREEVSIYPFQF